MSIPRLSIERARVPLAELEHWPGNARRGDVKLIGELLDEHGQYRPLVVQASTNRVIAGNHTMLALLDAGETEVDVDLVDVDDLRAEKINVADNRAQDRAVTDTEALLAQLQAMDGLDGTGYRQSDVDVLLAQLEQQRELDEKIANDQQQGEIPADPITQAGDVIRLGDHVLGCGSALDLDLWAELLGDRKGRLVVTSPPYNQKLDGFKKSGLVADRAAGWADRMANSYSDSLPEDDYQAEQIELLDGLHALTTDDAAIFYNHKHRYRDCEVVSPLRWIWQSQWRLRSEIVWNRMLGITQNARMFNPVDERLYWLTKGGNAFQWIETPEHKGWTTVWSIAPNPEVKVSAPFPLEIADRPIRALSVQGDVVLEPYCGSGTTLMACEARGRVCVATELNPAYCDVIVSRWEAATGRTAERPER